MNRDKIISVTFTVFCLFIALLLGFVIGKSQNLSNKTDAREARVQSGQPVAPNIDDLTSIVGKVTKVQTDAIEVTGVTLGDLLTNMPVKPSPGALPAGQPLEAKTYKININPSTEIFQLSSSSQPTRSRPSPVPTILLSTADLQVNMSVTVYLNTDGITAKKIAIIPASSPVSESQAQELLKNTPSLPSNISPPPTIK